MKDLPKESKKEILVKMLELDGQIPFEGLLSRESGWQITGEDLILADKEIKELLQK